jgi:spore maturation protein CgeB
MITNDFRGKRILFFSVKLFNYENIIADKMRSLGAIVDYYDERPANSIFAKGIIRFNRNLYKTKIANYYSSILKKIENNKYDYFFLIKGEVVSDFFIKKVKELNPKIILLYYTFDSFKNNSNAVSILKYFDRKFTFDCKDAEDYGLKLRPLFFSDDYSYSEPKSSYDVDLLFIGTAHSDRYVISESVADWCKKNNLKNYAFYYSPSRLVFLFFKLFDSTFKKFNYNKITFKSLNHFQITELYKKTRVVLDINHPNQNGLTMRVFEVLGSGKKLVTTNEDIKKYPFYNPNNIYVIDRNAIVMDKAFFEIHFQGIDSELYERISIGGWLDEIFFSKDEFNWLIK